MKSTNGFTIVELLIVVVVIAILAAITIVSYNGITTQANNSAVKTGLATLSKKLTVKSQTDGIDACYVDYQDIDLACVNNAAIFPPLPPKSIAQNSTDVIRFYMYEKSPVIAVKGASGAYFRVKDGSVKEITQQEYLLTNASDLCGATATYSTQNNTWTEEPHYC